MKKHLPSILLLCLFAMGCAVSDAPTAPQTLLSSHARVFENVRNVPIDGVFFNECCGEEVHISGTAHFLVSNNVIHVVVQNITGTGLSSSFRYVGRGASTETNVFYSNPNEGTFIFGVNLVNENGCSFKVKITNHITMNTNGEITADIERFETQCH